MKLMTALIPLEMSPWLLGPGLGVGDGDGIGWEETGLKLIEARMRESVLERATASMVWMIERSVDEGVEVVRI